MKLEFFTNYIPTTISGVEFFLNSDKGVDSWGDNITIHWFSEIEFDLSGIKNIVTTIDRIAGSVYYKDGSEIVYDITIEDLLKVHGFVLDTAMMIDPHIGSLSIHDIYIDFNTKIIKLI